jgi:hypothetical protein
MMEIHRVHRGDAGNDPHRLDARDQQRGKADIDELRRDEQRPEPRGFRPRRGDQRRCEMTDEHARDAIAKRARVNAPATSFHEGNQHGIDENPQREQAERNEHQLDADEDEEHLQKDDRQLREPRRDAVHVEPMCADHPEEEPEQIRDDQ